MSLLFRLYIFGLFPLLIAKTINPDGKETSVLLENISTLSSTLTRLSSVNEYLDMSLLG